MPEIIPAILTDDDGILERQVRLAETFAPYLHIDITDGRFVPSISVRAADIRATHPTIPFELHLMVEHPEDSLEEFLAIGAHRVIVHHSSTHHSDALVRAIRAAGCEAALALSPATLAVDLTELLALVDQVTFLAVNPGFQGGALIPGVLQKARLFHSDHPEMPIEADGGIRESNLGQVLHAGADRYVVGSAVWKTPDPAAAYARIHGAAQAFTQHPPA